MSFVLLKRVTCFELFQRDLQQSMRKRDMSMAIITMNSLPAELTEEEKAELETAEKRPRVFDEECPEMTESMLKQFHGMDSVIIKVSPSNIEEVKSFGADYREILSKLLNLAINDEDLLKKCI